MLCKGISHVPAATRICNITSRRLQEEGHQQDELVVVL